MMKRILVLDDDEGILEVTKIILSEEGFEVKTLQNVDHLQKTLDKFAPDLLLLDVFIGNRDGRKICSEVKQRVRFANMPIILMSANSHIDDLANADGYIEKPFDIDAFVAYIQKYAN